MPTSAVNSVCAEALAGGFPLVGDLHQPLRYASAREYIRQCEQIFEDARDFQLSKYRFEPRLLTPSQFRQVTHFAKSHGLKVRICGYGSAAPSTFSLRGRTLSISPRAPYNMPKWLTWSLDHEYGHARDNRLFVARAPRLRKLTVRGEWDESAGKEYVFTVMRFMREGLSRSDRLKFDRLRRKVLGDLDRYNDRSLKLLVRHFAELFRKGEEILDERFESFVMDDRYFQLRDGVPERYYRRLSVTNRNGERVDLRRLLIVAALQEADLWEKFTGHPNYDPLSLDFISSSHLKFFRLCIRGASRYFINTAAR